ASGAGEGLIERAAEVTLKERRKLIVVPRETPYSLIALRNLVSLTEAGATIIDANPGFYSRPKTVGDLVDFVVARILDHLGVEHTLGKRWGEK
ncbi:partial flavin prenyltransferase, partial [Planctomycetaceae bacterium]